MTNDFLSSISNIYNWNTAFVHESSMFKNNSEKYFKADSSSYCSITSSSTISDESRIKINISKKTVYTQNNWILFQYYFCEIYFIHFFFQNIMSSNQKSLYFKNIMMNLSLFQKNDYKIDFRSRHKLNLDWKEKLCDKLIINFLEI